MKPTIWGDYHTHTTNSDGHGTLIQTLQAADKLGLKQVGITDHGLRHIARGMKLRDVDKMRRLMEQYKQDFAVECLLGIEANIYSSDGLIDLTPQESDLFDYVIAGYHKAVWGKNVVDSFRYNIPALFANWKQYTDSQRRKYTKTMVEAVKSGKINVLAHLNYGIPAFVKEVGKAVLDYDVYVELNGKRVNMTDDEVMTLYDMGVKFILNSDGHCPERIGDVSIPLAVVDRLNLDKSKIVNWEKLPDMKLK